LVKRRIQGNEYGEQNTDLPHGFPKQFKSGAQALPFASSGCGGGPQKMPYVTGLIFYTIVTLTNNKNLAYESPFTTVSDVMMSMQVANYSVAVQMCSARTCTVLGNDRFAEVGAG
jgi:hypothetical protein